MLLTCLVNDCRNAKSHEARDDLLLDIDILSSLLFPSASLFIVVKLLYIVSPRVGVLLYSDSPRSFDFDLELSINNIANFNSIQHNTILNTILKQSFGIIFLDCKSSGSRLLLTNFNDIA